MRVLYATYPWAFETPGGGEVQLLKYEQHLRATPGLEVVRHDPWSHGLRQCDVVHFFSCMGGSVHFCRYVTQRGLPLVISASLWITEATRGLYPVDEIRDQLRCADAIVTNGECESEQIATVIGGLDRGRFVTVRNACDAEFVEPADPALFRDRFGIEGQFILNVGNVEPRKNQLSLIRAARMAGLPLVVLGHERDPAYAAACWAEGGESVRYLGPLAHEDILLRSAYAACAVFCLPSAFETPGLAALEAAAAGAKLVVTSEGSTGEYFGADALYVDPGSVEDIAEKLRAALAAPATEALQRRVATHFTWDRAVAPLAELYASLAGRGR